MTCNTYSVHFLMGSVVRLISFQYLMSTNLSLDIWMNVMLFSWGPRCNNYSIFKKAVHFERVLWSIQEYEYSICVPYFKVAMSFQETCECLLQVPRNSGKKEMAALKSSRPIILFPFVDVWRLFKSFLQWNWPSWCILMHTHFAYTPFFLPSRQMHYTSKK